MSMLEIINAGVLAVMVFIAWRIYIDTNRTR